MPLIPFMHFAVDIEDAPEVLLERVTAATVPPRMDGWFRTSRPSSRSPTFTGTVDARQNSFKLYPVLTRGTSAFTPAVQGSIQPGMFGCRVDVRLRLHPRIMALCGVLLGLSGLIAGAIVVDAVRHPTPAYRYLALVVAAVLGLLYWLIVARFAAVARRSRASLEECFRSGFPAVDSTTEPTVGDWSWLGALWFPQAKPVERRFNLRFLGLYFPAAAVALIHWSAITGGCSNRQLHQPEVFSCPGGSRVLVGWLLAVTVIASFVASRLALHRLARRMYAPLLLVLITVITTGLWMLIQHPRWGVPK